MTFLISTVTKCGIDDDKELWKEDDIIYEMEGTDDYGAERMKCFKENRMTLSHFIMDYVNKNIDKLEVQFANPPLRWPVFAQVYFIDLTLGQIRRMGGGVSKARFSFI